MIQLFLVTSRMDKPTQNHHLSCPIFLFGPNRVREKEKKMDLWKYNFEVMFDLRCLKAYFG